MTRWGRGTHKGKLLEATLVLTVSHRAVPCTVSCCFQRSITKPKCFPDVIASSKFVILNIQLKESLSESTSHLPKWYFIHHISVYSYRMLLQPFIISIYQKGPVSHITMGFVTLTFKPSFPCFNCKDIELHMLYFPSSNQFPIHKTLPLMPWQVCRVFDCTKPVTVVEVCLSAESTGRFARHNFLCNTVVVIPSTP